MKTEIEIKQELCDQSNEVQNHDYQVDQDHDQELRRGPWTLEEDTLLIHYVACHGEGRWNLLAKSAGLRRTGKSCRLRWLNYLKPDIKRGNLTPQEQLLILDLHSKWGNRWSKIASHLPGRTDNEIKNYWRTRVQKQAKQLNMESNSQSFIDAIRCYYMPILVEKIEQNTANSSSPDNLRDTRTTTTTTTTTTSTSSFPEIPENNTTTTTTTTTSTDVDVCVSPAYGSSSMNEFYSTHSCGYDMDLASTSASDIPFSGSHVAGHHWLGDDVAEDNSLWDMDELMWHFKK